MRESNNRRIAWASVCQYISKENKEWYGENKLWNQSEKWLRQIFNKKQSPQIKEAIVENFKKMESCYQAS